MLKAKDIMVKEAKAKEIMTKQVISVRKDTPVSEALELLWKNNITGVPVVEDDMTLVGVLTEKDVLTLFWAHEDQKNETISSFITQPVLHFDENDALASVCECLRNYYLRKGSRHIKRQSGRHHQQSRYDWIYPSTMAGKHHTSRRGVKITTPVAVLAIGPVAESIELLAKESNSSLREKSSLRTPSFLTQEKGLGT